MEQTIKAGVSQQPAFQKIQVANRYIMENKIGRGSFGEVYRGYDRETMQPVAIKIELSKTFQARALIEGKILKKLQGYDGIPKLHFCGTEGDYNVLVLELLGPNLEDILEYCGTSLSLKTVVMIADQLIQRIEAIHNRGFIHRDIKSDNFLVGSHENINKLYAIDFGLSKRYVNPRNGDHILLKKHKGLIGTARFASINSHLGLEQSRRDDLQAVGYLIVYLAKGSLPWQKVKAKSKQQKYKKILDLKDSYSSETLCAGLPGEFAQFLNNVKRLEFEEKPEYQFYRNLFRTLLQKQHIEYDSVFDWMIPQNERLAYCKEMRIKFKSEPLHKDLHQEEIKEIKEQPSKVEICQKIAHLERENDDKHPRIGSNRNTNSTNEKTQVLNIQGSQSQYSRSQVIEKQKDVIKQPSSHKQSQEEVNSHIMSKFYIQNDLTENLQIQHRRGLDIISEKFDEATPNEKSIIHRIQPDYFQSDLDLLRLGFDKHKSSQQKQEIHFQKLEDLSPSKIRQKFKSSAHRRSSINALIVMERQISSENNFDDFTDFDEDVVSSKKVYEFQVNADNPLQSMKSYPSMDGRVYQSEDVHNKAIYQNSPLNFNFILIKDDHDKRERDFRQCLDVPNDSRKYLRKSFDSRVRKRNNQGGLKDSSMYTEYEDIIDKKYILGGRKSDAIHNDFSSSDGECQVNNHIAISKNDSSQGDQQEDEDDSDCRQKIISNNNNEKSCVIF